MRLRNIPRAEGVLKDCPQVIKNETDYRGRWAQEVFSDTHPLHIEIGMGKGQFLLTLATRNPYINYIGIERYSSVLLRAVERLYQLQEEGQTLPNLRFICMDAGDIENVFAPEEVDRIYLNFSDPCPKARHARRRLTSLEYLKRYEHILKADGQVEFKTDNRALFDFSTEQLSLTPDWEMTACTYDLHHTPDMNEGNVMTEYEEKFSSMDHPICKFIAKRQSGKTTGI